MKQAVEFQSDGTTCRGYVFSPSPETSNGAGIVVAHGLAGTIDAGILEYGEGFAAAGFHALVFDYRGFGESDFLFNGLLCLLLGFDASQGGVARLGARG